MIKLIIFDLDNCVLNTRAIPREILEPLFDAVERSNVPKEEKKCFLDVMWHLPVDEVFKKCAWPSDEISSVQSVYEGLEIPESMKLETYGDENYIQALAVPKVLVTTGLRRFQESKIDSLGARNWFDEVYINDTSSAGSAPGKKAIFEKLMNERSLQAKEVLVVGDSGTAELTAGKELGMYTAQTLRLFVERWNGADYHIQDFSELEEVVMATQKNRPQT